MCFEVYIGIYFIKYKHFCIYLIDINAQNFNLTKGKVTEASDCKNLFETFISEQKTASFMNRILILSFSNLFSRFYFDKRKFD